MTSTTERADGQTLCLGCQVPELIHSHWLYCARYGVPYFDAVDIERLLLEFVEIHTRDADVIPFPSRENFRR